jgi:pilus assembly protein Flp/PilA
MFTTTKVMSFLNDEEGASGIEYALVAAMVAVVIAAFVPTIGPKIKTTFSKLSTALN